MTTEDQVEHVNGVLHDAWNNMDPGNIGCIVYVFDSGEHGWGAGFHSQNCDAGDAMVAIKRIMKEFGISPQRLARSM